MEDTIFMKILRREVPAAIVYEDDGTLAFLDASPNNPGHTLVIPKKPVADVFDADAETFTAVMKTVHKIAPAVRDAVGAVGVILIQTTEPVPARSCFICMYILFLAMMEMVSFSGRVERMSTKIRKRRSLKRYANA